MADSPFLAEIRIFACNFSPRGWALCNGQLLSIASNTALFSLIGTFYGGNGTSTFGLPNFQGNAAIGQGQGPGLSIHSVGEMAGEPTVTLLQTELPGHTHTVNANNGDGTSPSAVGNVWSGPGADRGLNWYNAAANGGTTTLAANASGSAGGNLPHNNLMPFLVLNFCIATQGIFPSRN